MTVLTWEENDWDELAVSNQVITHEGSVYLDITEDSFDSYPTGSPPPDPWQDLEGDNNIDDERAISVPNALYISGDSINGDMLDTEGFAPLPYDGITWRYWESSNNQETSIFTYDDNDNLIQYVGTDNPQLFGSNGGGHNEFHNPSPQYEEWRQWTVTFNWDDNTYDILWQDLTGGDSDESRSFDFANDADELGRIAISIYDNNEDTDIWIDDLTGITYESGSLVTDSKVS